MIQTTDSLEPVGEEERIFLDHLRQAEIAPTTRAWYLVQGRLAAQARRRTIFRSAAVMVGALAIAAVLFFEIKNTPPLAVVKASQKTSSTKEVMILEQPGSKEQPVARMIPQSSPPKKSNPESALVESDSGPTPVLEVLAEPIADTFTNEISEASTTAIEKSGDAVVKESPSSQFISSYLPPPSVSDEQPKARAGISKVLSFARNLKSGDANLGILRAVRHNRRLSGQRNSDESTNEKYNP